MNHIKPAAGQVEWVSGVAGIKSPEAQVEWVRGLIEKAQDLGEIPTRRIRLAPLTAKYFLDQNPDNRLFRTAKYEQLLDDIRNGRWVFNGEPLLISKEGLLNDGQHRCSAVIETNIPIDTNITFGLERASRLTVDQGAAKTAGDFLQMDGVAHSNNIAAAGRLVLAYKRAKGLALGDPGSISAGEIRDTFRNDELMVKAATFASAVHKHFHKHAAPAIAGACYYLLSEIEPNAADVYMRQIALGESLKQKDPAYAVREGLLRENNSRTDKIHMIFQGWNYFRQHKPLKQAKAAGNLPAIC